MSKIKWRYEATGYCAERSRGGDIHDMELRDSKNFLFLCHQKNNNCLLLKIKDEQTCLTV